MEAGRLGVARIGILTILPEEFDAAKLAFGATANIDGSPYFTSGTAHPDIVIRRTPDRGNMAAQSCAGKLIEDFRPELVVLMGIGGGVAGRDGVVPGHVVVPSYLHYAEFRKLEKRGELQRYFAYDQPSVSLLENYVEPASVDGAWAQAVTVNRPGPGSTAVVTGSLVAGEKILGNPDHEWQKLVLREFTDAVAVDMESIGVARAVHEARGEVDYNPRFMVVRGISDSVRTADDSPPDAMGEANTEERQRWKVYASCVAATFLREVATRFLGSADRRKRPFRSAAR